MENQRQKLVEELVTDETPVKANDLLAEIKPLLDDYFVGEITLDGQGITYRLRNGQKFLIKAEEVL